MKLAHLILCHKGPEQLGRLVNSLSHPDADIYIHVDKKTDIKEFEALLNIPRVYFINNRQSVNWGGYSMVQATLNSFEQILASGVEYGHVNLLSGMDYPLKSAAYIHKFCAENAGKAFMHISLNRDPNDVAQKLKKYYLKDLNIKKGQHLAERVTTAVFPRKIPDGFVPVGNSQWFTIPLVCVAYIVKYLEDNTAIRRLFKYMWSPDDMIFQSVLYNSPYRDIMVDNDLRYTEWVDGRPSPNVLTMDNKESLTHTDKLFARKFDVDKDSAILDYLDRYCVLGLSAS